MSSIIDLNIHRAKRTHAKVIPIRQPQTLSGYEEIKSYFGIDVWKDKSSQHLSETCHTILAQTNFATLIELLEKELRIAKAAKHDFEKENVPNE